MEYKDPFYNYFWFPWIVLTILYIVLSSSVPIVGYFIGLFVPFGFFNVIFSFISYSGLVTFSLLLFSLFAADSFALKLKIRNPLKRVVLNLVWLFLLTFAVDFILYGQWESLNVLLYCPDSVGCPFLKEI